MIFKFPDGNLKGIVGGCSQCLLLEAVKGTKGSRLYIFVFSVTGSIRGIIRSFELVMIWGAMANSFLSSIAVTPLEPLLNSFINSAGNNLGSVVLPISIKATPPMEDK